MDPSQRRNGTLQCEHRIWKKTPRSNLAAALLRIFRSAALLRDAANVHYRLAKPCPGLFDLNIATHPTPAVGQSVLPTAASIGK